MATLTFNPPVFPTPHTNNWDDISNWGGVVPTKDDDCIVSTSEDLLLVINGDCVCRNLTIDPGFAVTYFHGFNGPRLTIYGDLIINGITITDSAPVGVNFLLFGTPVAVQSLTATNLISIGGKRIYFENTCTINNCPFWVPCTGIDGLTYGPGTYHITDAAGLQAMADNPDSIYIIDNNIDMTGFPWVPIGVKGENPFTGQLDGQGFTISNFSGNMFAALGSYFLNFGYSENEGSLQSTIQNIAFETCNVEQFEDLDGAAVVAVYAESFIIANLVLNDVTMTVSDINNVAAVIGSINEGSDFPVRSFVELTIDNVDMANFVMISPDEFAFNRSGGIVGVFYNNGTGATLAITNCTNTNYLFSHVDGTMEDCGGIAGLGPISIESCTTTGQVTGCPIYFGGIIGNGLGGTDILNCTTELTVIASEESGNPAELGGIAGHNGGFSKIIECSSVVDFQFFKTDSHCSHIGGILGSGQMGPKCFSEGSISIQAGNTHLNDGIGGLIGSNGGALHDCYSRVSVNAPNASAVGGLAGFASGDAITNCYASGDVTGDDHVGGFIGMRNLTPITNCYSAGIVVGNSEVGGLLGGVLTVGDVQLDLTNCAWYTGANDNAIGDDGASDVVALLATGSYGTDEADNTAFYNKRHPVYAQE